MKNTYKIIIRQFIEDSDDGENGHYEKRTIIEELTNVELKDYINDNYIYDFELINKPVETTNEKPKIKNTKCAMTGGTCNCSLSEMGKYC